MEQKNNKWLLNIIFLILEYPFAFLLSIFMLDGDSVKRSYEAGPFSQFVLRFLFAFIPLLLANVTISCIIKLVLKLFKNRVYMPFNLIRFLLFHNTFLIGMLLVMLLTQLIIFGYV